MMDVLNGYKLVPVELLDRALFSIMEQGFDCDGLYELVHIQKLPSQPIYDEAKERELFKSVYLRCDLSEDWLSGAFKDRQTRDMWDGWRECAQSRAKAGEVGHE